MPQRPVVRVVEGHAANVQGQNLDGGQEKGQVARAEAMEEEKLLARQHEKTDSLRVRARRSVHLDEDIPVLRSEECGEVKCNSRIVETKETRGRVQEDACCLAPHLARLRHVAQRQSEESHRFIAAEESTGDPKRRAVLMC